MTTGPDNLATHPMDELTADDVAAFLRDHPDFLIRRPDVVPHLLPPPADHGGGVIDMRQYLLERLRGEYTRLSEQQTLLVEATRANLMNQRRVHAAVLHMLSCTNLETLVDAIVADLSVLLDVDAALLLMEQPAGPIATLAPGGITMVAHGAIDRLLGRADVALRADIHGASDLWVGQDVTIRSEALVRLCFGATEEDGPVGLLAFGSVEPDMFHPGQATDLLLFLAGAVERAVMRFLD